jgi:hypothetical protein
MPPEKRRLIEQTAAVLAFDLGWEGTSSKIN